MRLHGILTTTLAATLGLPMATGAAAQSNPVTDRYLTAVQVELTGRVDTKNAVAGQEVTAKTKDTAKLADGTTLPKGTKLVGHVVQARAGGKEEGVAVLALLFDRAELGGGKSVNVRSVIRGVGVSAGAAASQPVFAEPVGAMDSTTSAGGGMGIPGRTTTRGGLGGSLPGTTLPSAGGTGGANVPTVGGPMGGDVGGVGGRGPSIGGTNGTTIGGVPADTRSLGGSAAPTANRPVSDAGERVSPAAHATALPGVMLSNSAVASASGTLTAYGMNITLESGTQITLGVITR